MESNSMTQKRLQVIHTLNRDAHQTVLPRLNLILIRWKDFWLWIEKYLDSMRFGMIGIWDLVKWDHSYSIISLVSSKVLSNYLLEHLLKFHLVDDTLQIREVHTPNDERDPFPVLLQRQRVQIGKFLGSSRRFASFESRNSRNRFNRTIDLHTIPRKCCWHSLFL